MSFIVSSVIQMTAKKQIVEYLRKMNRTEGQKATVETKMPMLLSATSST
jgi:hypothetical protein